MSGEGTLQIRQNHWHTDRFAPEKMVKLSKKNLVMPAKRKELRMEFPLDGDNKCELIVR